jgi:anti-sigma factor RsiW
MAVLNERVMNMVRDEIQKHPEVTSQELFEKAKKLDRGMRSLSARQFNATYPLQVRRTMAPRRRRARGTTARTSAGKDRVRSVLLEFARAVAGAQDRGALVEVVGNLDEWVDRVAGGKAGGGAGLRRRRPL